MHPWGGGGPPVVMARMSGRRTCNRPTHRWRGPAVWSTADEACGDQATPLPQSLVVVGPLQWWWGGAFALGAMHLRTVSEEPEFLLTGMAQRDTERSPPTTWRVPSPELSPPPRMERADAVEVCSVWCVLGGPFCLELPYPCVARGGGPQYGRTVANSALRGWADVEPQAHL